MPLDTFLSLVKSQCIRRKFNYCRAVEYLAEGMYREGYTVNEVISQIEISANTSNNFTV